MYISVSLFVCISLSLSFSHNLSLCLYLDVHPAGDGQDEPETRVLEDRERRVRTERVVGLKGP